MNERIRELVEKSYIYDKQNDSSFFNKEKFAELIVQTCADIGERYADGNYEVRNQILEHFGLEEQEE